MSDNCFKNMISDKNTLISAVFALQLLFYWKKYYLR